MTEPTVSVVRLDIDPNSPPFPGEPGYENFGLTEAWNRVERLLPDRALGPWLAPADDRGWYASVWDRGKPIGAYGSTPAMALNHLADKLDPALADLLEKPDSEGATE